MKKRTVVWTVAALLGFSLISLSGFFYCSQAIAAEKITLTFMAHTATGWNDVLRDHLERFEAVHPNVEIVFNTVPHKDLNTKFVVGFATGTAPDIMGVFGPWMKGYIDGGNLSSAPNWTVEDLKENFVPLATLGSEYRGKIYGYPQHFGMFGPIINTRIYNEYGFEPPTTWQGLVELAPKMDKRDKKGNLIQVGAMLNTESAGSWNVITWTNILFAYEETILTPDNSRAAFNSPKGRMAADIYTKLTHPELGKAWDIFCLDKVATYLHGSWTGKYALDQNPDLQMAAIPALKGTKQVTSAYIWFWAVNARTKGEAREEAWRFAQFLCQDKQYIDMFEKVGLPPMTFSLADKIKKDEWSKIFFDNLAMGQLYYSKIENWEEIDLIIGRELEKLATEEIGVDQFLKEAEDLVNLAL